jgi:hypothetical protein
MWFVTRKVKHESPSPQLQYLPVWINDFGIPAEATD